MLIGKCFLISVVLLIAGCSSSPNFPLFLHVHADTGINPDASTQGLPLEVRFYQLKAIEKFQQMSFRELWQADHTALGEDLIERHGWVIKPGTQLRLKLKPKSGAKYLGVMTIPREPEAQIWRAVTVIPRALQRLFGPLIITFTQDKVEIA